MDTQASNEGKQYSNIGSRYRNGSKKVLKKGEAVRPSRWIVLALAISISACTLIPKKEEGKNPSVAEVINSLKSELQLFAATRPSITPKDLEKCAGPEGKTYVNITPIKATLQLKIVATSSAELTAGATIPVGESGVTINPSFLWNRAKLNTQLMELDLDVGQTKEELRAEIDKLRKEIDADNKFAKAELSGLLDKVNKINKKKSDKVREEYKNLIEKESDRSLMSGKPYEEADFKGRPLAEALYRIRESLLAVDHQRSPCLKPRQLKTEIGFQVKGKEDDKIGVSFVVVSIGGGHSRSDERTQTLTVIFDLADSSSLLIQ